MNISEIKKEIRDLIKEEVKKIMDERVKSHRARNESRKLEATGMYNAGLQRVKDTTEPKGQKFSCGSRVHIVDELDGSMRHFPAGHNATVNYVYAHAFGGDDVENYCLDIDDIGGVSWYPECTLTAIDREEGNDQRKRD